MQTPLKSTLHNSENSNNDDESTNKFLHGKKPLSSIKRELLPYTSHYCEENIYKFIEILYNEYAISDTSKVFAVFISNESKQIPVWMQRSGNKNNNPVVWDYHVIALVINSTENYKNNLIFDFDSLLSFPCNAKEYIMASFHPEMQQLPHKYRQYFRVISGELFLKNFSSDRSHMQNSGIPAPSWPLICGVKAKNKMQLHLFWDMTNNKESEEFGQVMDLSTFISFASRSCDK